MIYELVNSSLHLLRNQWDDLAEAFRQLIENIPADDPLELPSANAWLVSCENEIARLAALPAPPSPLDDIAELIDSTIDVFEFSEDVRTGQILKRPLGDPNLGFWDLYTPEPLAEETVEVTVCRDWLERLRAFIASRLQEFREIDEPEGQRIMISGIRGSIDDIASYPILTSSVDGAMRALPSAPAAPGALPLQRMVEGALREVLGRTPKPKDPRSFVAALTQSFQIRKVDDIQEIEWTPKRYAGQTDLGGGITGGQASLYKRAKETLDHALKLLDGFSPLLPDPDEELVDAATAIVRTELKQLVGELALEGGPRIARVEGYFRSLQDEVITDQQGNVIAGGHLGYLRAQLGLVEEQVNTLEEEAQVTNYQMLEDYVQSLRDSWNRFRDEWLGRDLGTRLVLLERVLSVVAQTVEEVYAAMDSVFVEEAERQVASFQYTDRYDETYEMLVSELLAWVTTVASDEAPGLIQDGGRRGVAAIVPTLSNLADLVSQFNQAIPIEPRLPEGLRHPRVRQPLQELQSYLSQALRYSQDVWRP
jgi:hypothetical protein